MTKEKFTEILKEAGYSDEWIEELWEGRPPGDIDERKVKITATELIKQYPIMRK